MVTKYSFKDGKVFSDNGHGPVPLIMGKSGAGEAKVYSAAEPKAGEAYATPEQVLHAAKIGGAPAPVIEGYAPSKKAEAPKG